MAVVLQDTEDRLRDVLTCSVLRAEDEDKLFVMNQVLRIAAQLEHPTVPVAAWQLVCMMPACDEQI